MTKEKLIAFENDIAAIYTSGKIRGPIHLRNGNEEQLIDIFAHVRKEDYVFSTWANHLHALLKGIPEEKVKARILEGESMAMNFPEYKFYTSAIVAGCCPIAVGVASGLLRKQKHDRVYCFIGDMAFLTGIAQECIRYSINYNLPMTWVIEDNDRSVSTPTSTVWKEDVETVVDTIHRSTNYENATRCRIKYYKYRSTYPHSGTGVFVSF